MNRRAVVAAIAGAAFVASCVTTTVNVRPETTPPTVTAPAASFWEALSRFDLEQAKQLAADRAQEDLAFAVATAHEGNVDEAVVAARRSWLSMRDSESRQRAREWLEELLMSQSRWKEILDVYEQDPAPVEPTKDFRPFASVYQNAPMERYQFADGGKPFPIAINAGMPVAEVDINGKRKKLVIDTGASITTVSTDVARESGIVAGRDPGRASTATARTVAIRGAVIEQLRLGGLVITNHPAAVIESSALRARVLGLLTIFNIDGVLGWNAIRQMRLHINYRDKTAMISAPEKLPVRAPRNLFGLAQPILELADEDGERLFFLLDTGAGFTHLHEDTLRRIDRAETRRKTLVMYGAGGSDRYKSAVVPRLTLRMSGHALEFRNLRTAPGPNTTIVRRDGRLGSDVGRNGSITIDALNGRFELALTQRGS